MRRAGKSHIQVDRFVLGLTANTFANTCTPTRSPAKFSTPRPQAQRWVILPPSKHHLCVLRTVLQHSGCEKVSRGESGFRQVHTAKNGAACARAVSHAFNQFARALHQHKIRHAACGRIFRKYSSWPRQHLGRATDLRNTVVFLKVRLMGSGPMTAGLF